MFIVVQDGFLRIHVHVKEENVKDQEVTFTGSVLNYGDDASLQCSARFFRVWRKIDKKYLNSHKRVQNDRSPYLLPKHDIIDQMVSKHWKSSPTLILHKEDLDLEVLNSNCEARLTNWENSGLHPKLLRNIGRLNYQFVRPIQVTAIPQILCGYDIFAQTEPSCGRTAAYGVALIHQILQLPETERKMGSSTFAVILIPAKSVKYVTQHLLKLARGTGIVIKSMSFDHYPQGHILVTTCGKMVKYLKHGKATVDKLKYLVVDISHKMSKNYQKIWTNEFFGIMNDVQFKERRQNVQLLFFAGMMNTEVQFAAKRFLKPIVGEKDAVRIVIQYGWFDEIKMHFIQNDSSEIQNDELDKLIARKDENGKIPQTLIFVESGDRAEALAKQLNKHGVRVDYIYETCPPPHQELVLASFKNRGTDILVATDLKYRSIRSEYLAQIINFDLPIGEAYLAYKKLFQRAGIMNEGNLFTFVNMTKKNDIEMCSYFIDLLRSTQQQEIPEWMDNYANVAYSEPVGLDKWGRRFERIYGRKPSVWKNISTETTAMNGDNGPSTERNWTTDDEEW